MSKTKAMMRVWLEPVGEAGGVKKMRLTLVSPPWPEVGQVVNYLGRKWAVVKTSGTRGCFLSLPAVPKAMERPFAANGLDSPKL